jgi:hypothetical protein
MNVNFTKLSGILLLATTLFLGNLRNLSTAQAQEGGTILPDARPLPAHIRELKEESVVAAGEGTSDAPGYYDTSVFMTGSVAVGIILPESAGSGENWTTTEKNTVVQEIKDGMNWWAAKGGSSADLSFQYDVKTGIPTSYEPITLSTSSEGSWIGNTMSNLGYSTGDYFERVYSYTNHIRNQYDSDWAFVVFVIDSSNDVDGKFSDGYFAYAYLSGPFMVMTYDNDGWGISNMNMVATHETGHIFLAADQYYQAGYGGCTSLTARYGYLGMQNSNCEYNNPSSVPSIMRHNEDAVDVTARGQIGWRDSDSDGKPDPVDTAPIISLSTHAPDPTSETSWSYYGFAEIPPYAHAGCSNAEDACYHEDVTTQTLTQIQYRVDGGVWSNVTVGDGALNSDIENFSFTISSLSVGTHSIQVQATASSGNISSMWEDEITIDLSLSSATLFSPSGDIGVNNNPSYTWNEVASATWYYFYVNGASGSVIQQWYEAALVCNSGVCSVTPATALGSGTYTWWVQTWNSGGFGPWSSGLNFTVATPPLPNPATLVTPTGDIGTEYSPEYRWNEVDGTTWYYLYINGPSGKVLDKWYQASEICAALVCTITPDIELGGGTHTWWVQTWNGAGYGPWSSEKIFNTALPTIPGAATLIAPADNIGTDYSPEFRWNKDVGVTWYYLWINGPSGKVLDKWYPESAICAASVCTVTPDIELDGGTHTWWVQTWNTAGYGPWSSAKIFNTTMPTLPGATTLIAPVNNIGTQRSPEYRWNEVMGATWYYLYVNGPSGKVLDKWYPESAICTASVCTVAPDIKSGGGTHTWWVQTWNSAGYGPWSSGMNFSVN